MVHNLMGTRPDLFLVQRCFGWDYALSNYHGAFHRASRLAIRGT